MKPETLIKKYLAQKDLQAMQLATIGKNGQPWISTVYFVADKQGNIYWLSLPTRRHSKEIAGNKNVAVTVVIKKDFPVIGLQAEGTAIEVTNLKEIARPMLIYIKKYATGRDFYKRAAQGTNQHKMYKFTPSRFSLFDEVNFPDSSPQTWETNKNA